MKKDEMMNSNLGQAANFLAQYETMADKPPSAQEMRRSLYTSKLLGIMWFDETLSPDLSKSFYYYMNPNWPDGSPPDGIEELVQLGDAALEYVCQRLRQPTWAKRQKITGVFRYSDVEKDWEKYRNPGPLA